MPGRLSASLTTQTSDAFSFSWLPPRSNSPFLPCILLSLQLDFGPNPGPWPDGSLRGRFLSVKTNDTAWVLLQLWWSQAAGPLYLYRNPRAGGLESLGRVHSGQELTMWWGEADLCCPLSLRGRKMRRKNLMFFTENILDFPEKYIFFQFKLIAPVSIRYYSA